MYYGEDGDSGRGGATGMATRLMVVSRGERKQLQKGVKEMVCSSHIKNSCKLCYKCIFDPCLSFQPNEKLSGTQLSQLNTKMS
jgi:hypothetical protein